MLDSICNTDSIARLTICSSQLKQSVIAASSIWLAPKSISSCILISSALITADQLCSGTTVFCDLSSLLAFGIASADCAGIYFTLYCQPRLKLSTTKIESFVQIFISATPLTMTSSRNHNWIQCCRPNGMFNLQTYKLRRDWGRQSLFSPGQKVQCWKAGLAGVLLMSKDHDTDLTSSQ